MIRVTSEFEGDAYALARTLRAGSKVDKDVSMAARMVHTALVRVVSRPGTGRVYTTNFFTDKAGVVHPIGTRTPHAASAPGQPPARDSGDLARSIKTEVHGASFIVAVMGEVAAFLEKGTSKMRARPFFQKTIRKAMDDVRKLIAKGIEQRQRLASKVKR